MILGLILSIAIFICKGSSRTILLLWLFLMAMKNLDSEKLIKINFKVCSILFVIIILLALIGIIPNWIYQMDGARGSRYSLGFNYPTITIGIYLAIVLMRFYIKKSTCSYIEIAILELINIALYYATNGRLGFYLTTFVIIAMILSKFKKIRNIIYYQKIQQIIKILCYSLPILICIITVLGTYCYNPSNSIYNSLNSILSNRLNLGQKALQEYGVTLFGQDITWYGYGGYGYIELDEDYTYNYVDTSYIRILLDYGIILEAIIIIAYTKALEKSFKEKNYYLIFVMFAILIWATVESPILNIVKNIFIILVLGSLLEYGKIEKIDFHKIKKKIKGNKEKINKIIKST